MRYLFIFLFNLIFFTAFAQEIPIQGKVLFEDHSTAIITVTNKQSKQIVKSDNRGVFNINAKLNDTLVFSKEDVLFDFAEITQKVIDEKALRFQISKEGTLLKELVIDDKPIFSFGGTPLNAMEKLELSNEVKVKEINGVALGMDGVFNRISGRSKLIKKVKAYDTNFRDFQAFKNVYNNDVIRRTFGIPADYVDVFVYYIVDQEGFVREEVSLDSKYQIYLIQEAKKFKVMYEL